MTATAPSDVLDWAKRLLTEGWCIIPAAMPPSVIAQIDADLEPAFAVTPFGTGAFYGETTQRFGRLLTRSAHSPRLVQHALIQAIAEQILSPWCDCIQLNVMQAIGVHPGAPAQAPHRDHDMWAGPVGEIEYLVNVLWPLTPFRSDNGATTLWSHSHGKAAREDTPPDIPVAAEMVPGDALMFLGSTLHAAGANRSDAVRRAIVVGYALGWLKPYENPWLAYPPAVARRFDPALAALVGYRQHRPNLGNFEGQCPSVLLGTRVPGVLGAIDALRPDQQAMVEAFAASQLPAP